MSPIPDTKILDVFTGKKPTQTPTILRRWNSKEKFMQKKLQAKIVYFAEVESAIFQILI